MPEEEKNLDQKKVKGKQKKEQKQIEQSTSPSLFDQTMEYD